MFGVGIPAEEVAGTDGGFDGGIRQFDAVDRLTDFQSDLFLGLTLEVAIFGASDQRVCEGLLGGRVVKWECGCDAGTVEWGLKLENLLLGGTKAGWRDSGDLTDDSTG